MELKIVAFDITNLNKNLDLSKIDKDYIIDNTYYQLDILDKLEKSEYKGPKNYHIYVLTYEGSDDYIYLKSFNYEPITVDKVELAPLLVYEAQEYKNGDFKAKNIYLTCDSKDTLLALDLRIYREKKRLSGVFTQPTGYQRDNIGLFINLNNKCRDLDDRFTTEEYKKVKKEIIKFNKLFGNFILNLAISRLTFEFNDTVVNSEFVY
jgi:hypothetical protein|nr:MAG TPA: hypothetical protein [Caudoviricetes sp.]